MDLQSLTQLMFHKDTTPYAMVFLSSTALEVIAVATLLTVLALGLVRVLFRSSGVADRWLRLYRAFDAFKLYKMVIPLACLTATVWVWNLVQGA